MKSLFQICATDKYKDKSSWEIYGYLTVDRSGFYNMSGSFEGAKIQYIRIEWGRGGVIDAVCVFDIEVMQFSYVFGIKKSELHLSIIASQFLN